MIQLRPHQSPAVTPFRLEYLDGVRGLAALYVVLHHAAAMCGDQAGVAAVLACLLANGHDGVVVFIVLSGYCLMLPVLRSPDGRLRGGFAGYIRRRALRIVPPYYATIFLVLALVALVPAMNRPNGSTWDLVLPVTGTGTLVSHLALVHNLSWRYIYKIDSPMWSVATEWQIYFAFPALLMVRRRAGLAASVALGLAAGYAVIPLTNAIGREYLQQACPWMLGAFALGMAAAELSTSNGGPGFAWRDRVPWRLLAAGLGALVWVIHLASTDRPPIPWYCIDLVTGLAASCLLIGCTLAERRGESGLGALPLQLFVSRWPVALGGFSYSLYLLHQPVLGLVNLAVLHWVGAAKLAVMLGVATPLSLVAAYLFFLAVERRFLPSKAAAREKGEASPAGTYPTSMQPVRTTGPG